MAVGVALGLTGMQLSVLGNSYAGTFKLVGTLLFVINVMMIGEVNAYNLALIFGFLMTLMGDYFLSFSGNESDFQFGLLSFLISYLTFAILNLMNADFSKFEVWVLYPIAVVILLSVFQFQNFNNMGDAKIPVIVYLTVQVLLVSFAIMSRDPVLILGSVLLYISDSIIAHHVFNTSIKFGNLYQYLIMPTYYFGLLFITLGLKR